MTKPKMIGGDREADRILSRLPRKRTASPNAFVLIDDSGRLKIVLDGGGILTVIEHNLDRVRGDELYEW